MKISLNFIDKRREILILILLLIISSVPRLWKLTDYPPIIVDEAANLRDMHKLISYDTFHPIDYEWGYGQATLIHYPAILLTKLGFADFFTLRLTSVILSLVSLIPFFYIVKKFTNLIIAFCSTLIFSFSYYYLQFSRVGWTNIHTICLGLLLIWLIILATEKKSKLILIISAIIAGLLMYAYRSGEIYIFAGVVLLTVKLIKYKNLYTKIANFVFFLSVFLLVSLPWINKILSNWELYNLRSRVVSVFNVNIPYHGLSNQIQIFNYQILTSIKAWILMLPLNGSEIENQRYLPLNHAVVSPIIAVLFLIGIVIAIYQFKKTYIWFIIYTLGLIFGQILTVDPPNGSRGLILLPIIYIFSGFALNLIYTNFKKNKLAVPSIILASVIISCVDFIFYQNWMNWIKV